MLWTHGALETGENGTAAACPKPSLCAEGWGQIVMLMIARLTAFSLYVSMALTMWTKCHALNYFLSYTYVAHMIPFEYLHTLHRANGIAFCVLALAHTIAHFIRWGMREAAGHVGELAYFCRSAAGFSGVVGMSLMLCIVTPMAIPRLKKALSFERRLWLHWLFVPLAFCMCVHSTRTLVITLIFVGLWLLDFTYVVLFRTFRLEMVELTRLDDGGVQMLWVNPPGFHPRSGEFIKVKFPWLKKGGAEWHPFSFYLREATAEGLSIASSSRGSIGGGSAQHHSGMPGAGGPGGARCGSMRGSMAVRAEGGGGGSPSGASQPAQRRATLEHDEMLGDLMGRLTSRSSSHTSMFTDDDVRNQDHQESYNTTQCFIMPVGDWTKELSEAVKSRGRTARHRTCWIRGPYSSPFSVAKDFSQIILFASGIGITPALAVMGQYRGAARIKFLVWATRSAAMLRFFAPLMSDAQVVSVYYTGKPKLSNREMESIRQRCPNLFIHQRRPKWTKTMAKHVVTFESSATGKEYKSIETIPAHHRGSWCGLYCGGSHVIKDELAGAARKWGLGWQVELFDW